MLLDGHLNLKSLRRAYENAVSPKLSQNAFGRIDRGAKVVADIVASGQIVYGINTGFGLLANTSIARDDLMALQRNLVLSHACGVGPLLSDQIVRLVLVLKAASLAQGASGVRRETVEMLLRLLEKELYPCIPSKGSVGASGDLAPLAHLSATLLGIGEARLQGKVMPAAEALKQAGLNPIELGPKEGLALLNGTQVSTALCLAGLFETEKVFAAGIVAGALSTDALKGSDTPFDARIHELRGQPGQIDVARMLRELMQDSAIRESHRKPERRSQGSRSLFIPLSGSSHGRRSRSSCEVWRKPWRRKPMA